MIVQTVPRVCGPQKKKNLRPGKALAAKLCIIRPVVGQRVFLFLLILVRMNPHAVCLWGFSSCEVFPICVSGVGGVPSGLGRQCQSRPTYHGWSSARYPLGLFQRACPLGRAPVTRTELVVCLRDSTMLFPNAMCLKDWSACRKYVNYCAGRK